MHLVSCFLSLTLQGSQAKELQVVVNKWIEWAPQESLQENKTEGCR